MTNLSGKFNALQTFLTALFVPVTTPLAAINTKLETGNAGFTIGTLLMTYIPPWFTSTANANNGIQQILGYIAAEPARQIAIQNALIAMNARDALAFELLTTIRQSIGDLTFPGTAPLLITQRNIANMLEAYVDVFGNISPSNPSTAMQYLQLLQGVVNCLCIDGPPSPIDPLSCQFPLVSTGQYSADEIVEVGPRRTFARWQPTLPTGFSFTNSYGLGGFQMEIANTDWSNWYIYVDSAASTYSRVPGSNITYTTRQWQPLDPSNVEYAFSVADGLNIVAYLCQNEPTLPSVCTDYTCNLDIRGKWGWQVPSLPSTWSVKVSDNWYAEDGSGNTLAGPFSANAVYAVSSLPATPFIVRCGVGVNEAAPVVTICPPT